MSNSDDEKESPKRLTAPQRLALAVALSDATFKRFGTAGSRTAAQSQKHVFVHAELVRVCEQVREGQRGWEAELDRFKAMTAAMTLAQTAKAKPKPTAKPAAQAKRAAAPARPQPADEPTATARTNIERLAIQLITPAAQRTESPASAARAKIERLAARFQNRTEPEPPIASHPPEDPIGANAADLPRNKERQPSDAMVTIFPPGPSDRHLVIDAEPPEAIRPNSLKRDTHYCIAFVLGVGALYLLELAAGDYTHGRPGALVRLLEFLAIFLATLTVLYYSDTPYPKLSPRYLKHLLLYSRPFQLFTIYTTAALYLIGMLTYITYGHSILISLALIFGPALIGFSTGWFGKKSGTQPSAPTIGGKYAIVDFDEKSAFGTADWADDLESISARAAGGSTPADYRPRFRV